MASQLFGNAPVALGATSVTILGQFGSLTPSGAVNYQVNALPSSAIWTTAVSVSNKTASSFQLDFSVPAPDSNSSVDWFVVAQTTAGGGISTLQDYLDETRRLLRDEQPAGQSQLYTNTDLIAFINRAMRQRDLDLGMNRVRVSFPMVTRQFAYDINTILTAGTILTGSALPIASFTVSVQPGSTAVSVTGPFTPNFEVIGATASWLTTISVANQTSTSFDLLFSVPAPPATVLDNGQIVNPFVDVTISGVGILPRPNIIDVMSIVITPLGQPPGGIRYPLGRWPYSRLSYLLSTSYPTYPVKYSVYGVQSIMVAPPPAAAYPTEWDFTAYASTLTNLTDADPLPYPWTDPIPFWAAHFAKLSVQRFDEADAFMKESDNRTRRVMGRGRPIGVANPWSDLPRNAR